MQASVQMFQNDEDFTDLDTQTLGSMQLTSFFKLRATGRSYAVQSQANGWIGSAKISPQNQQNNTEFAMLQNVTHPFVIPYVGSQQINQHVVVFTELADNYSLADLLNGCQLTEPIVQKIAWQILLALQKTHKQGFVHGNLKLDNIIFRTNPKTGGIDVQLCNFSLGRVIGERVILKENGSSCGGLYYAPESFYNNAVADPRMDMFSFGLILYLMLTKNHPLPYTTLQEYYQYIQQVSQYDPWFQIDEHISQDAADLVTLLLAFKIDQRLTVVQALQSPFFPQEWRNQLLPEGQWLKWNVTQHESLPRELFEFAFGQGNTIINRVMQSPGYFTTPAMQVQMNQSYPQPQLPQYQQPQIPVYQQPGQTTGVPINISQSNTQMGNSQFVPGQFQQPAGGQIGYSQVNLSGTMNDPSIMQPNAPNQINQSTDIGGEVVAGKPKRRIPPVVTPTSYVSSQVRLDEFGRPRPSALQTPGPGNVIITQPSQNDWPNDGITPVIAGQVVTKCFNDNKIPSEFHMQVFIGNAQDEKTKGHIARLGIFDEYLKRLNSYIQPLEEKLQEFNQRRRAELVRLQALEASRIQQGIHTQNLPADQQPAPDLLIDNVDDDDQVDQDLLRRMSNEEYCRTSALCDVLSQILMTRIVPVKKALKDGFMTTMNKIIFRNPQSPKINRSHMRVMRAITMKADYEDATVLVKGEGNEMMHRDGLFEISLKFLRPLIRSQDGTPQPAVGAVQGTGEIPQSMRSFYGGAGGGGLNSQSGRKTKRTGGKKAIGPGSESAKPGETFNKDILDMILLFLYNILTIGSNNAQDVAIKIRKKVTEIAKQADRAGQSNLANASTETQRINVGIQNQRAVGNAVRQTTSEEQLKGCNPFYGRMVTCDMFNALHSIMLTIPSKEAKEKIAQIIANGYRARPIPKGFTLVINTLTTAVTQAPDPNKKFRQILEYKILIWCPANYVTWVGIFREMASFLTNEITRGVMADILKASMQILQRMANYGPPDLQGQLKQEIKPDQLAHIRDVQNSDQETKELVDALLMSLAQIRD